MKLQQYLHVRVVTIYVYCLQYINIIVHVPVMFEIDFFNFDFGFFMVHINHTSPKSPSEFTHGGHMFDEFIHIDLFTLVRFVVHIR